MHLQSIALSLRSGASKTAPIAAILFAAATAQAAPPGGEAGLFDRLDSDKNGQVIATEVSLEQRRLFDRLLRLGDENHDQALSRDEFSAALVPSRPEKPIEEKQPTSFPQANAIRWLLLSMDTNGNVQIERREVPEDLRRVFDAMRERIDTNKNGVLETVELARGGRPLAQIAGRYVQQNDVDIAVELKRLEQKLGAAANRFESGPLRLEDLTDTQKARQAFLQLDANNDGQIEVGEIPEPLRRRLQRLFRTADRDGNGRLSEREFITGARRIAGRAARQAAVEMPSRDAMPNKEMPAKEQ
jgi:Ca2+-binding EF-hand superfamily protein